MKPLNIVQKNLFQAHKLLLQNTDELVPRAIPVFGAICGRVCVNIIDDLIKWRRFRVNVC